MGYQNQSSTKLHQAEHAELYPKSSHKNIILPKNGSFNFRILLTKYRNNTFLKWTHPQLIFLNFAKHHDWIKSNKWLIDIDIFCFWTSCYHNKIDAEPSQNMKISKFEMWNVSFRKPKMFLSISPNQLPLIYQWILDKTPNFPCQILSTLHIAHVKY